jgi:DNA polymerase-3 subunit delta'
MWHGIRGHDEVVEQFRRALERGRLASTFLFVGPSGIGKRLFALKLAQALLCERHREEELDPCGQCPACVQVAAGSHPDVDYVAKPADKSFIPLELLIGDKEHRMREGLCYNISLKPYSGRRKVAILDDADYLNKEGANCLLKTLEEPPPRSLLILLGTSEQRQLPTIRSRCQIIRFKPLSHDDVADLLVEQGHCTNREAAARAAQLSQGSLDRALLWLDPRVAEYRSALLEQLGQREIDLLAFAKQTQQFVDEAGKDTTAKRNRMKDVLGMAEAFYRQLLRTITRVSLPSDAELAASGMADDAATAEAVSRTLHWWPGGEEGATACLDVCLEAANQVDANANLTTLIECWLDELSNTARTGRVAV